MERIQAKIHVFVLIGLILLNSINQISSLSVTVNDEECVQEYVLYEGDTVSGNFVVVDHDIFWGSDHPGLDFTVRDLSIYFFPQKFLPLLRFPSIIPMF